MVLSLCFPAAWPWTKHHVYEPHDQLSPLFNSLWVGAAYEILNRRSNSTQHMQTCRKPQTLINKVFRPKPFQSFSRCLPTLSPVFYFRDNDNQACTVLFQAYPPLSITLPDLPKICCFITTTRPSQPAPWKSLLQQVGLTHQSNKQDAANRDMDPGKDRLS